MAQGASLLASNFNNSPYFKINYFYLLACIYVLLPIPFDFLYKTEVLMLPVSAALRVTILLLMIWLKRHRLRISSLCLVLAIFCIFTIILGAKNTIGQYGSPYLIVKMVVVVGLVIILYDTLSTDDSTVLIKFFLVSLLITVIIILFASIILYITEGKAQPEAFGSIIRSFWWSTITLTTIGYGDVYPITVFGKIATIIIAIAGIGIVAIPAGIIAGGFSEMMRNKKK